MYSRMMIAVSVCALAACNGASGEQPAAELIQASYDGADYQTEAQQIAHGERLATVLNCKGCHTRSLEGRKFPPSVPFETGLYASNLTLAIPEMNDAQLERLLREGIHPSRDKLLLMPSDVYQHVSDTDMAALIAYLRTLEPSGEPTPPPALTREFKEMMNPYLEELVAEEGIALETDADGFLEEPSMALAVRLNAENPPPDLGPDHAWGRYLTMTTCAECHGSDLVSGFAPPLPVVAAAYDRDTLTRLLTIGESASGVELGLMAVVGRQTFAAFTESERAALVDYVLAVADQSVEGSR